MTYLNESAPPAATAVAESANRARQWLALAAATTLTVALASVPARAQGSTSAATTTRPATTTPVVAPTRAATAASDSANGRPLSLEEALRLAEGKSETVRIARAAVDRARGQFLEARSYLLPQVNTTLAYQRQIQSQFKAISEKFGGGTTTTGTPAQSVCAQGVPANPTAQQIADALTICPAAGANPLTQIFASPNTVIFGLTGSQTLFSGGRILSNVAASRAGGRAAEVGLVSARAAVTLDVTQAYYDAALADRLVAIAESSLVQTERTYRQTQLSRQVGNLSEFEALRARVTRENQVPQVIQARSARQIAYLRLRQLLEIPLTEPLRLTTPLLDDAPVPPALAAATAPALVVPAVNAPVNVDALLAADSATVTAVAAALAASDTSVDDRATVRQARENVTAQRNLLRAARAQRLPALALSTNYQRYAYPSTGFPAFNEFYPNWSVSLGLSLPIFTGGRIKGDVLVAQANLAEARAQLDQVREGAALDAQVALTQLEQAAVAYAASAGTSEQAARAYQIAEVRYREGISTQVELNDSRLLLQQSQANRAQAARDLQVARVRLSLLRDLPLQAAGSSGGSSTQSQQQQQQQQQQRQSQQQGAQQGQSAAGQSQTGQFGGTTP
ncbi:MAG TPA: TolC family protein [Gemmatimonadaceae bacterium]|nr:TolC family protein [Gemmatimonadaceae bacterium]